MHLYLSTAMKLSILQIKRGFLGMQVYGSLGIICLLKISLVFSLCLSNNQKNDFVLRLT